jgi:hypothetical protein
MTKLYVSLVTFHKKLFSGSVIVNAIIVLTHYFEIIFQNMLGLKSHKNKCFFSFFSRSSIFHQWNVTIYMSLFLITNLQRYRDDQALCQSCHLSQETVLWFCNCKCNYCVISHWNNWYDKNDMCLVHKFASSLLIF